MQHGICKSVLFLTLNKNQTGTIIYSNNLNNLEINNQDIEELIRIFAFIIAGLSISGFPFLSGYITKLLVKSDLPNEALIIFNSSALLTSGVYVKLIISRLNNIKIKDLLRKVFNFLRLNLFNVLSSKNITLILVSFSVFGFSFIQSKYFSLEKIQMSFITLLLGFVFYLSFMGIKSNPSVSNVRKTIDIIGAPFVVAALLLANLTYLKIL